MGIKDCAVAEAIELRRGERGFSILQLVVVVAVVLIVSAFAYMGIANARENMRLSSSTRQLAGYIEKARADSVRRHASGAARATITFTSATTYTVAMDFNKDGTIDAARTFNLDPGVVFTNSPLPAQIFFDWRGRATANTDINLRNSINQTSTIGVTASGDVTVDSAVFIVPNDTVSTVGTGSDVSPDTAGITGGTSTEPTPVPTAEPTPGATPSSTPTTDPTPTSTPTTDPTPTSTPATDPTPTSTPATDPTPTSTPATDPTPTATPNTGPCTASVNPSSFSIVKSGGSSRNVTIVLTSGLASSITVDAPDNLTVTTVSTVGSTATFNVVSNNNTRGTFTVTFSTPCGSVDVTVTVTNNNG